jgi:hypothetical protein
MKMAFERDSTIAPSSATCGNQAHVSDASIDAAINELREVIDDNIAEHHYDILVDCVRAALVAAEDARRRD